MKELIIKFQESHLVAPLVFGMLRVLVLKSKYSLRAWEKKNRIPLFDFWDLHYL
jgi:hypothetical protein